MPEDIYEQDRFYKLGSEHFLWMYHNPDAVSGDQFVKNHFNVDLLKKAIECQENPVDIFGWIGSECRQYCSDVGDPCYDFDKGWFEKIQPFSIGCTWDTINKMLCDAVRDTINKE